MLQQLAMATAACNTNGNDTLQCQALSACLAHSEYTIQVISFLACGVIHANSFGNVLIQEGQHDAFWCLLISAGNSIMLLCNLCCGCICATTLSSSHFKHLKLLHLY